MQTNAGAVFRLVLDEAEILISFNEIRQCQRMSIIAMPSSSTSHDFFLLYGIMQNLTRERGRRGILITDEKDLISSRLPTPFDSNSMFLQRNLKHNEDVL